MSEYLDVSVLKGKTLTEITVSEAKDEILFHTTDGETYKMYHEQDCCEDVHIEDICGNIDSLIGEPLLVAEEVSGVDDGPLDDFDESYTWTFYKFATIKGSVTIRWYGTSNGYYSESVEFVKLKEAQNAEETPTDEMSETTMELVTQAVRNIHAEMKRAGYWSDEAMDVVKAMAEWLPVEITRLYRQVGNENHQEGDNRV